MNLLEKIQAIAPDVTESELNKVLAQLKKAEAQINDSEVVALVKRIKDGRSSLASAKGFAPAKTAPIDRAPVSAKVEPEKPFELPQDDDLDLESLRKAIAAQKLELERLTLQAELLDLQEQRLQSEQAIAATEAQVKIRSQVAPELIDLAARSGASLAQDFTDRTKAALEQSLAVGKQTPLDAEIGLAYATQRKASQLNRLQSIVNGTPELLPEMRMPQGQTIDV